VCVATRHRAGLARRQTSSPTLRRDPPVKVEGWVPAGELRAWLHAEDGWWGLVSDWDGLRLDSAEDLRLQNR
jgi:hypothetical protein